MPVSFFSLGPDTALRAVEAAGFTPTGHVTPLTCLENRVYDVRIDESALLEERGAPVGNVVLKFYRPNRWDRAAILEEHGFLADLQGAEVPVCSPFSLGAGAETLAEHDGLLYAIWPRTGGRSPDELRDEALPVLGRLLARIHAVGATRESHSRPVLDATSRVHAPLEAITPFLPESCRARYVEAARELAALYEERSRGVPLHRIHGDCHRGNLLERDGTWFFLDFDDFGSGPAVQDVWMLLPGRDAHAHRQRALLLEAYREFRDFDDAWLGLVEPLRALRFVWYAGWIARRWEDPVFPDAFPHFGTREYWERETRDLEEQARGIEGDAPAAGEKDSTAAEGGEAGLTNEDYFWDL